MLGLHKGVAFSAVQCSAPAANSPLLLQLPAKGAARVFPRHRKLRLRQLSTSQHRSKASKTQLRLLIFQFLQVSF